MIDGGVVAHWKKSSLCAKSIDYLGFELIDDGIRPQANKVDAILRLKAPTNRKQVRQLVGMVNYYRDLWPKRAPIMAPLTELTSEKLKFDWSEEAQTAFEQVKTMVAQTTMLTYPDFEQPFVIHTDASIHQMGAVLSQNGRPIAFWSRKLNEAQAHYPANKCELLAIKEFLKEYRTVLWGREMTIYTDHLNFTSETFNDPLQLRWRMDIEEFSPKILHLKGEDNVVADALSRLPTETTDQATMAAIFTTSLFNLDLRAIAAAQEKDKTLQSANCLEISGVTLKVTKATDSGSKKPTTRNHQNVP